MDTDPLEFPSLDAIRANRARLGDRVETTPVRQLKDPALDAALASGTRVWLKEELFQRTGSFKPRGALSVMLDLDAAALERGVTGVSAGNHAISLAYSAQALGTTAKVVMPKNANPFRIQVCRELGAEVELVDNVHQAFARVREIEAQEGRVFVHPYEGPKTALGTASVGLEFMEQVAAAGDTLDAVIVATGGTVESYPLAESLFITPQYFSASPDGRWFALWGRPGGRSVLNVYGLNTRGPLFSLSGFPRPDQVRFSPDGRRLAVVKNRTVEVWSLDTRQVVHTLTGQGRAIGALAFDQLGYPILQALGKGDAVLEFNERFNDLSFWPVLIAGLTPFPYKVITIMSGWTGLSLTTFVVTSIVARAGRFFLVATLLHYFGAPIRDFIERRLGLMTILFVVLLLGGFFAVRYL